MKPSEILAGPPSPVAPEQPPETAKEEKPRQRRRVRIFCEYCQQYHQLPKPAPERSQETKNESATKELSPFA